jgi:hypothetical protein
MRWHGSPQEVILTESSTLSEAYPMKQIKGDSIPMRYVSHIMNRMNVK